MKMDPFTKVSFPKSIGAAKFVEQPWLATSGRNYRKV